LARACTKLAPAFDKTLAEEGLSEDTATWPTHWGVRFAGRTSTPPVGVSKQGSAGRRQMVGGDRGTRRSAIQSAMIERSAYRLW